MADKKGPAVNTKGWLREKLAEFHEEPPSSWTKSQLQARLSELRDEGKQAPVDKKTELIKGLTKAKNKAGMREYITTTLQTPITGMETMAQLEAIAIKAIMQTVEATDEDEMGFGQYSSMTYLQVLTTDRKYYDWCKQMRQEEVVNWRMARFLNWADQVIEKHPEKLATSQPCTQGKATRRLPRGPSLARGSQGTGAATSEADDSSKAWTACVPESGSETEMVTEVGFEIEQLEGQIRELRRRQARHNKEKTPKVIHNMEKGM